MANGRVNGPNVQIARFVFDNMWSVDRLEAYATSYYPDGVPLHTLRYALGRNRVPLHQYARTLVKFATVLLALGHVRTPASILLELFLFRAITPLTQAEVSFLPVFFFGMFKHKEEGEGGGWGGYYVILALWHFVHLDFGFFFFIFVIFPLPWAGGPGSLLIVTIGWLNKTLAHGHAGMLTPYGNLSRCSSVPGRRRNGTCLPSSRAWAPTT